MKNNSIEAAKKLAKLLQENPKQKVIFLVGAGISTSCGIPDFRSPETGLYHNLSKLNLPYAEAVFDIDFFEEKPRPFYLLASELYPGKFKPSRFHLLLKLFQDNKRLQRIYTQNIDTLERQAGISQEYIIEAHGSFAENHCINCKKIFKMDVFKEHLNKYQKDPSDKNFARCNSCNGLIKPNIVFFGEDLPKKFFTTWDSDLETMSEKETRPIVIVVGTSLTVYPFANLPTDVQKDTTRALISREIVGDFKVSPRKTDIIIETNSDDAADIIARELGWSKQLNNLIKEHDLLGTIPDVTEELESISKDIGKLTIKDDDSKATDPNSISKELDKLTIKNDIPKLKENKSSGENKKENKSDTSTEDTTKDKNKPSKNDRT
ncbi:Sir2 histone deacetylase Hst2 [Maudiozyma exigua]|uniref:NAD-dependent protein deacetylase n=1 Tax=Maudiozyma exigua TaxID=34358 RepID=A0A9P7BD81_MAUEX|nr:Sir2 histone deacetylase Hst2 [Kazachstania exigua]